jgi:hypothetical protein
MATKTKTYAAEERKELAEHLANAARYLAATWDALGAIEGIVGQDVDTDNGAVQSFAADMDTDAISAPSRTFDDIDIDYFLSTLE